MALSKGYLEQRVAKLDSFLIFLWSGSGSNVTDHGIYQSHEAIPNSMSQYTRMILHILI